MGATQEIQNKLHHEPRSLSISRICQRKKIAIIATFSTIATVYFSLNLYFLTITPFAIPFLVIGLLTFIILSKRYKKISSASVKGETIIIKNIDNENFLTPIKSIRKMRTRKIGRTLYTSLEYKLDGKMHTALLLSDTNNDEKPQLIIRNLQREIKNKKANL